ncbi:hypothetical protein LJC02_04575, partial [Breznakia sp. OttesenSCG-928-G09]|nr:hypothetical protein [Breznakia sp. OttesenSCG-928-G09]
MKKISLLTVFKKIFLVCMIMFISLSAISIPQSVQANEEASETEINEETQTERNEVKEIEDTVELTASDGTISVSQAQDLDNLGSLKSFNNVHATLNAVDKTSEVSVRTSYETAILSGVPGIYSVIYSFEGQSKTVNITVLKNRNARANVITATNATVNSLEMLYTNRGDMIYYEAYLIRSCHNVKVNGEDTSTWNQKLVETIVSEADWYSIKMGKVGTYNITFQYNPVSETPVSTTVKLTIENKSHKYTLDAKDGIITDYYARSYREPGPLPIPINDNKVVATKDGVDNTHLVAAKFDTYENRDNFRAGKSGTYNITYINANIT